VRWEKRGRIYVPDASNPPWARHRAFPPTPYLRPDGRLRIYVGMCDADTVARFAYVDVDPDHPTRVLAVSQDPLLDVGAPGTFDEHGILPISLVDLGDRLWIYYVGFQRGLSLRHFQFTGLAESTDGGETFRRVSGAPVLDRTDAELLNRNSPFVRYEGGLFRMWYAAGSSWTTDASGRPSAMYDIRYLESADGVQWASEGEVCFQVDAGRGEYAHGKPWVEPTRDGYEMFYSVRTRDRGYRLGYAVSPDGRSWTRRDEEVGIDVSQSGWDSEMIAYPAIFHRGGERLLFYNGNGLGIAGFGYAVSA
jgi:predicted GH43/DUF377 family glycosyl hydrolase